MQRHRVRPRDDVSSQKERREKEPIPLHLDVGLRASRILGTLPAVCGAPSVAFVKAVLADQGPCIL